MPYGTIVQQCDDWTGDKLNSLLLLKRSVRIGNVIKFIVCVHMKWNLLRTCDNIDISYD